MRLFKINTGVSHLILPAKNENNLKYLMMPGSKAEDVTSIYLNRSFLRKIFGHLNSLTADEFVAATTIIYRGYHELKEKK